MSKMIRKYVKGIIIQSISYLSFPDVNNTDQVDFLTIKILWVESREISHIYFQIFLKI